MELWNIDLWYYSLWIFFVFVIMSYLLGYIGYAMAYEKDVSDGGKTPLDELGPMVKNGWRTLRYKEVPNKTIVKKLDKVLDSIDNEIDMEEVLRKQLKLDADDINMNLLHLEDSDTHLDQQQLEDMLIRSANVAKVRWPDGPIAVHLLHVIEQSEAAD